MTLNSVVYQCWSGHISDGVLLPEELCSRVHPCVLCVTAIHDLSHVHHHGMVASAGHAGTSGCARAGSGATMLQIKGEMNL